eukprot:3636268-Pyramimonas_sp.AAC.1
MRETREAVRVEARCGASHTGECLESARGHVRREVHGHARRCGGDPTGAVSVCVRMLVVLSHECAQVIRLPRFDSANVPLRETFSRLASPVLVLLPTADRM